MPLLEPALHMPEDGGVQRGARGAEARRVPGNVRPLPVPAGQDGAGDGGDCEEDVGAVILMLYWLGGVLGFCALLWVASVYIDWRMMRAEVDKKARTVAEFEAWLDEWAVPVPDGRLAEFEAVAAAAWGRGE